MQREVIDRLAFLSSEAGRLDADHTFTSEEAALGELLQGRSEYHLDCNTTLASFSMERVSVPDSLVDCPCITSQLNEADLVYLKEPERMLHSQSELEEMSDPVTSCMDPTLKHNKRAYHKFIKKLHDIGFWHFIYDPKEYVGVIFV